MTVCFGGCWVELSLGSEQFRGGKDLKSASSSNFSAFVLKLIMVIIPHLFELCAHRLLLRKETSNKK
jgi:hypothetical protein